MNGGRRIGRVLRSQEFYSLFIRHHKLPGKNGIKPIKITKSSHWIKLQVEQLIWSVEDIKTLDVAGADAIRTKYDAIEGRRMHGRDDGLRKTESKDAIRMD
ncbi:hypothetical protein TNCV_1126231 [Trichonephila clavipes]|nr:hypothetical protein TNCV_1126231 [Trichonephila clavipes]